MRRVLGLIGLLVATILVGGCWDPLSPPLSPTPPELESVQFAQVDWYEADGTIVQANSLYGVMRWTYVPDPTTVFYLNVKAALSLEDEGSWVIQNLPLFPVDDGNASARRESAFIDLAELGLAFDSPLELVMGIDVRELYVSVIVGSSILPSFPDALAELVVADTVEHWATGMPNESLVMGPFVDPGEPAPIRLNATPTKVNIARDVHGVQEGSERCAAGAFARSLDWLNREHDLGIQKTAQQIYQDLIAAGVSQANEDLSPARDEWIAKKDEYAREKSDGRIVTTVWDRRDDLSPIPGVTEASGDFAEWLKREIRTSDVEVAYFYPGNAHIVTVLEVYTLGSTVYVKYRDDERQDDNALGDSAVKHAAIYRKDGEYRFGSDRNVIYFAVSESVAPAVTTETQ